MTLIAFKIFWIVVVSFGMLLALGGWRVLDANSVWFDYLARLHAVSAALALLITIALWMFNL